MSRAFRPAEGDPMFERGLPSNLEAERSILGAILLENSVCLQAIESMSREDFFLDAHRRIYDKMVALTEASEPVDLITLTNALRNAQEFEQIGGATYIASLIDGVPRTDTIEHYVIILQRKSLARRLMLVGGQIAGLAMEEDESEDLLKACQRLFYEACEEHQASPWIAIAQAAADWLQETEDQLNGSQGTGLRTGLYAFDDPLGGLQRQELLIVAGRPSQGKTTVTLEIAKRLGKLGKVGGYFSIEMGYRKLGERTLANEGRMDTFQFRTGQIQTSFEERERWAHAQKALNELASCGLYVCDDGGITTLQIRARAHRLKREKGQLDFLVIDYLGLMDLGLRPGEKRYEALGEATRKLKLLARELDCSVIPVAQLNREVEKRRDPTPILSDLADTGDIEKHADAVAFVYRTTEGGTENDKTWIRVAKNRNGPTATTEVRYVRNEHRFENV